MKRLLIAALVVLPLLSLAAADNGFLIEIEFDHHTCKITLQKAELTLRQEFDFADVRVSSQQVLVEGRLLADSAGLHIGEGLIPFDQISVSEVETLRDRYKIMLEKQRKRTGRRAARRADRVSAFEHYVVPEEEFVRGDLLIIGGDILIEGEVNGNVIALFGDIHLASTAICQRDVLAVGGSIKRHRDSRIYGTWQGTEKWKRRPFKRKRRYQQSKHAIDLNGTVAYNRVDGLIGTGRLAFHSQEKFMPEFYVEYGYGFWSKRSKYRLGFEQRLFDYHQTSFGGEVYRRTATEDEWRCRTKENSLYAIIAREDFRDYYEGEGGSFFFEQTIGYDHTFRLDYRFEELRFLEANPNLWSLFGGGKRFRGNFSSVTDETLTEHLSDYDKDEASLLLCYTYSTVEGRHGELLRSGWYAMTGAEHASQRLGSDFDYDRVVMELRRYQPLTYRQNLNFRLIYGTATGNLPLHKYFYLGGIRTLRAYDIKEFCGTRMAMANLEYVLDFSRSDVGVALLFDIGKTGWESNFLTSGQWRGDVGVGLTVINDIRLELTRQINGFTNSIQISILINRSF